MFGYAMFWVAVLFVSFLVGYHLAPVFIELYDRRQRGSEAKLEADYRECRRLIGRPVEEWEPDYDAATLTELDVQAKAARVAYLRDNHPMGSPPPIDWEARRRGGFQNLNPQLPSYADLVWSQLPPPPPRRVGLGQIIRGILP
jgi:hypothetical protein